MIGLKRILKTENDLKAIEKTLDQYANRVNQQLKNRLPEKSDPPAILHQAMHYAVLGSGKRIRPALLYATGEALGTEPEKLDTSACAVELMHSYSLIHDDLPAMDNSDLRRGQPTCHREFGEATAILAGDAIHALVFTILANDTASSNQRIKMIQLLAESSGSLGMAGGQVIDITSVNKKLSKDEIEYMHSLKTGALIKASVLMAAIISKVSDADILKRLVRFSDRIGLAFQIRDDILDIETDTIPGNPQEANATKPTYPDIVGLQQAAVIANDLLQQALNEICVLGLPAEPLIEVSKYMVMRDI